MLYEIENLGQLETLTLELKVGDILSIGEPRIEFTLRDDSLLTNPMCKSSSVAEAIDRVTAYVSKYLVEKITKGEKNDLLSERFIRIRKTDIYSRTSGTSSLFENLLIHLE